MRILNENLSGKIMHSYIGKRILITGGAGYLAASLVNMLKDIDCRVIRVDRPGAIFTKVDGLAEIKDITADLRKRTNWENLLDNTSIIFHLAAQTSAKVANQDAAIDLESNVMPMLCLLETCRNKNLRPTIIFSGTVTEAGIPVNLPVNETHPDNPITVYDLHKLMAENYLKYYVSQGIVKGAILRLANLYGPGPKSSASDRGVLNLMMRRALNGELLTVYGAGDYLRDYTYVEDAALAFIKCAADIERTNGQHFVIGTGEGHTITEVMNLISDRAAVVTSKKVAVKHIDPPQQQSTIEKRNFVADSGKFFQAVGWKAKYSIKQGIDKTINYFSDGKAGAFKNE